MKKKTMLLALAASLLLGGAASALEPSASYMDSLIRAGQPIPMADGREHVVTNPRLIPSQTAPVRAGTPEEQAAPTGEKKDLPALRYLGHGPAKMPQPAEAAPDKDAPDAEKEKARHPVFHGVGPAKMPRHHHVKPAPKKGEASVTVGINIGPDHPHHPHHPHHRHHHHRR